MAAATWANDVPLETVAYRSRPMACGPNVDQAAASIYFNGSGIRIDPSPVDALAALVLATGWDQPDRLVT
jgi:hypothetical protein